MLALAAATPAASQAAKQLPHRVFASSRFDIDRILARPYDASVPFGSTGSRVWATSPQGWGFRDGVQIVYTTNLSVFDPVVRVNGVRYTVQRAEYYPSHIHMVGAPGSEMTATASFTYSTDRVEAPLSKPFRLEKRWTCWSSGHRTDWYEVDLGRPHRLAGLNLYFYDDQPSGGCAPPESVGVDLWRGGAWHAAATAPLAPHPGRNAVRLAGAPQIGERVRVTFRNRGKDRYTGLYGFEPIYAAHDYAALKPPPAGVTVAGDKWIDEHDVLVSRITVKNGSSAPAPYEIDMNPGSAVKRVTSDMGDAVIGHVAVDGTPFEMVGFIGGLVGSIVTADARCAGSLAAGASRTVFFCCGVSTDHSDRDPLVADMLATAQRDPVAHQAATYQHWFDENVAYFDCSDPLVRKMYYHRWYNLKKNSMDPRIGALQHRTFSEGRWTSDWYANVISYGAAHQIREARWLRDPSYAWGHLQTWTDNPRPDGIFPSHITFKGQQGGQYTDWIASTAWDVYQVHPSKGVLASIADTLANNVEGWLKVYGWNDSPLLVVDSHWWTGMEWQPSFFSFAGYKTGGGGGTDPKYMTPLRRVDLTAYNFGNAQSVARVYRELGRTADAARMQAIADETREAVLAKMWDPRDHWFHSLRASDFAVAPAKEIIGLYPFYFDLPPAGKGYEAAWSDALDPRLFWTRWPLASAAKDCPAYDQHGWPVGPGGSGCMWNGPTWPHADSIVMTAMAETLRHYAPSALTRRSLLDLFTSFARAQYRDQDPRYPWTGEFYDGDTGKWKTDQRDYNHSTWIDPLISDLVGLVPRNDDVLEIDPLLPDGAWSYWVLDGQAYRKHDVTVAFDAAGGHVAPGTGFRGFAVYLDGRRIYHGPRPVHLLYDMGTRRLRVEGRGMGWANAHLVARALSGRPADWRLLQAWFGVRWLATAFRKAACCRQYGGGVALRQNARRAALSKAVASHRTPKEESRARLNPQPSTTG